MTTINHLAHLKGRRALITGAAGGLGRVFADTLAELGADVFLVDRAGSELHALERGLSERWQVDVACFECDLEQQEQRSQLIYEVTSRGTGLDVLVNNAAFVGAASLNGWAVPFDRQSIETWRRAFEVNLTTVFELCQAFAPALAKSKGGCIVNIASIYGEHGPDWRLYEGTAMGNPAAYSASKGGLIQLTRWLATTLAPSVRVNCLSPGGIARGQPEAFVERYISRTPLRRMATEDDFRGAIAYLASDLSRYVSGHNLVVDGGWGAW